MVRTSSSDARLYKLEEGAPIGARYRVVELLGTGWEGVVYRVEERGTGVQRAAKIWFPRRNPRGAALRHYARKLDKLRGCPVVMQYHHSDEAEVAGLPVRFMIAEYLDGIPLSELRKRQRGKRFGEFEALSILHALAAGLEPVHQMGEYHGDLHADNILIRRRGVRYEVKTLDFFNQGRASAERRVDDVVDLLRLFRDLIGGRERYPKVSPQAKSLICGLRRSMIAARTRSAGLLRVRIENLGWE